MLKPPSIIFPENIGFIHVPSVVPYVALVGIIAFILGIVPGLIWIERVVLALVQDRSGPNRVGPRGLLQTIADGVKLFFKEDTRPRNVDVRLFYLAPIMALIPALAGGATLPLQTITYRVAETGVLKTIPVTVGDVNIGLLYILALSSLQVYGIVLAGWSSNNKYSLLGGLRSSAQLISYELTMGLSILCVVVLAGSLKLSDIVEAQNILPFPGAPEALRGSVATWFWLRSLGIPVLLFSIAMLAETNRAPFDLPEAESELVAGFHTEYTSMKFAIFFMGEYASMLTISGLNAALFWGGPLPPLNVLPFTLIPGFVWFITKIMLGFWLFVWIRGTLPRLRYDALMNLGWKRMLPLGLVWLFLLAGVNLALEANAPAKAAPVPTEAATSGAAEPVPTGEAVPAQPLQTPPGPAGVPPPSGGGPMMTRPFARPPGTDPSGYSEESLRGPRRRRAPETPVAPQ